MSSAFRHVARISVIALVVGFAPATSAVGSSGVVINPAGTANVSRATVQAAGETAAPDSIQIWVDEAVQAHSKAERAHRLGKLIEAEAAKLRPGRFVWKPDHVASGPVEVVVSIAAQRAYIFRDRQLIGVSTVSTGRQGNRTPTGSFPILEKKREHYSNLYNNAPMPNMQRMTWDGIALHAGSIPGYPASHGCVRLPMEFSNLLFGATRVGSVVHVVADTPRSEMAALEHAEAAAAAREARAR